MITLIIVSITALFLLTSCSISVEKNAQEEMVERTLDLKDFNKMHLSGSVDVIYTVSDSFCVKLEAPKDFIERLDVNVKDSILRVSTKEESREGHWVIRSHDGNHCKVYVSAPSLSAVNIAGSTDFVCNDTLTTKSLALQIAGSGDINIKRLVSERTSMSVAGSGDIDITSLKSDIYDINIAGSGDVKANCDSCGIISVSIVGSGDIELSGYARDLRKSIAGSGDFKTEKLTILK